jgi:hypothetical protein
MLECMNVAASLGLLPEAELMILGVENPLRAIGLSPAALPPGAAVAYDPAAKSFLLRNAALTAT